MGKPLKSRRIFLLTPLILLFVVGIPTGLLVREYRREQASRDLIAAIKADNAPAAITALKAGADPNIRENPEKEKLSTRERFQQFIDRIVHPHIETEDHSYSTPLMLCLREEQDDPLVKVLLDAGADPNLGAMDPSAIRPDGDATPLEYTIQNDSLQSLRLLIQHRAKLNQQGKFGETPLCKAVDLGRLECMQILLNAGADINAPSLRGHVPLHCACWDDGNAAAFQLLMRRHPKVNLRDDRGETPLDLALNSGTNALISELRQAGAKTGKELDAEAKPIPLH